MKKLLLKVKTFIIEGIGWKIYRFFFKIKKIYRNLKVMAKQLNLIYGSHDYDYVYFYTMMRQKLERLYKYYSMHSMHIKSPDPKKELKYMKIAIELLRRIEKDQYETAVYNKDNLPFLFSLEKKFDFARKRYNNDMKLLFEILSKHSQKWWV